MSQTRSAYPPDIEDLMPAARDLASDLGRIPGRNEVMTQLHVGAPKAKAILDRLVGEAIGDDWNPDTEPSPNGSGGHPPDPTEPEVAEAADPEPPSAQKPRVKGLFWWLLGIISPAFVAIWSGWVDLGRLTGFGPVHLLPGIRDDVVLNTAITLPIGMETYAALALRVWLTPGLPTRARTYAMWSAFGALALGCSGQVAYHLMVAAGMAHAPWQITTLVACLPVGVLGMGAALAHLLRNGDTYDQEQRQHLVRRRRVGPEGPRPDAKRPGQGRIRQDRQQEVAPVTDPAPVNGQVPELTNITT